MLLTPAYTIKKAYGSVKLKAYDNYIKSNRKEAREQTAFMQCTLASYTTENRVTSRPTRLLMRIVSL